MDMPPKVVRKVDAAEQLALADLEQYGVTAGYLIKHSYRMLIGNSGTPLWVGDGTKQIPEDVAPAAMLWACCHFIRHQPDITNTQAIAAGEVLGRFSLAMRYPEIKADINRERQANAGCGKKGASSPLTQVLQQIGSLDEFKTITADTEKIDNFNEAESQSSVVLQGIEGNNLYYRVRLTGKEKIITIEGIKRKFRDLRNTS